MTLFKFKDFFGKQKQVQSIAKSAEQIQNVVKRIQKDFGSKHDGFIPKISVSRGKVTNTGKSKFNHF